MICLPRSRLVCGAWLALSLCIGSTASAQNSPAQAAWTLMVYLDADNDLERPMMRNLEEMAHVGSSETVNLIVLAARSPRGDGMYTNAPVLNLPNWSGAKLLRVEKGRLRELADWGALDMGDPQTLSRFLKSAVAAYPAQRYALILGDHGMAWAGVAVAESSDSDSLALDEITAAFHDANGVGRLELIGFDACVMASLEVARTLAPLARYLVASEEIEPADGWDYASLLTALTAAPSMDGAALGRSIVDTYHDYFAKAKARELQEKAKAATLAVIDLDKIAAVDAAVKRLGIGSGSLITRAGHDGWVRIAHARSESEEYGRTAAVSGVAPPGSEVYDLAHVAQNLKKLAADNASTDAADAVLAAVGKAVVYNVHGAARPHANGLSIFFPPDQATLAVRSKNSYNETSFAQANSWYPFLQTYAALPASEQERNRPKPAIDPVTSSGRMASRAAPVKVASRVHSDQIEEASFILANVDEGARTIIGAIPVDLDAAGDLNDEWDGEWFTITDQKLDFIAPITSFEELEEEGAEDIYWAEVPAQARLAGESEWFDVTLNFELDFRGEEVSGDFIYAVEYTRHGPREVDLDEGDELRPVYEVIDSSGQSSLEVVPGRENVLHIGDLDDLRVERTPVPPGRYQVGFEVLDLEGRRSERFVEVQVGKQQEEKEDTQGEEEQEDEDKPQGGKPESGK
jgi:Clostripain family